MAQIVFVHGMRMERYARDRLHSIWHRALHSGLKKLAWGRTNEAALGPANVDLVYWADFFAGLDERAIAGIPKGPGADKLFGWYYAFLRGGVRAADRLSTWDRSGRPASPVAHLVNALVHQSAVYMRNGPVANAAPGVEPGAFFQVQKRFRAALKPDTRVVIGHSLGSVIAFEGLCLWPHAVDTFITVGSPIATPRLILQPMRERLGRLLSVPPERAPSWPNVARWFNFCAPADVWSAPVTRLAPIFDRRIRDVTVHHGNPHRAVATHKLATYLRHPQLIEAIAGGLDDKAIAAPV